MLGSYLHVTNFSSGGICFSVSNLCQCLLSAKQIAEISHLVVCDYLNFGLVEWSQVSCALNIILPGYGETCGERSLQSYWNLKLHH